MINDYYIDPTDTNKLIEVCETFDQACQECVDNRDNPEYQTTREFGFSFEQLSQFAGNNPTFDYQKLIPNHVNTISYFFSDSLINNIAKERKAYERRMKRYDWYHSHVHICGHEQKESP